MHKKSDDYLKKHFEQQIAEEQSKFDLEKDQKWVKLEQKLMQAKSTEKQSQLKIAALEETREQRILPLQKLASAAGLVILFFSLVLFGPELRSDTSAWEKEFTELSKTINVSQLDETIANFSDQFNSFHRENPIWKR
jgi:hypothetical protein